MLVVGEPRWTPHRLEQALWSHYVTADLKPALLDDMPEFPPANGDTKIEDHSEKASSNFMINGSLKNLLSNRNLRRMEIWRMTKVMIHVMVYL